jgi:hypothetical protein
MKDQRIMSDKIKSGKRETSTCGEGKEEKMHNLREKITTIPWWKNKYK